MQGWKETNGEEKMEEIIENHILHCHFNNSPYYFPFRQCLSVLCHCYQI